MVDAREGVTGVDKDVAAVLRRSGRPVLVAANKVDSDKAEAAAAETFVLGFPQVFPISASHGRGVGDMLDAIVGALPKGTTAPAPDAQAEGDEADDPATPLRLAFIGKPNVGKSSLVNCLLGEERVLVHDQPGTTRDPIDTPFSFGGREYVLVDTAGMRRRRSIDTLTEHVAAKMARDQLDRCDVAVLVIDAREGATAEDARLASLIEESGRGALVVLNKKDLVGRADIDKKIESTREALSFMRYAPVMVTSAVTRAGVTAILTEASKVLAGGLACACRRARSIPCSRRSSRSSRRPSGMGGRHVRLYYATQASVRPPTFFVSTNHPAEVGFAYRRFLINQLRKAYGFDGTPVRLVFRAHRSKRQAPPPNMEKERSRARKSRRG